MSIKSFCLMSLLCLAVWTPVQSASLNTYGNDAGDPNTPLRLLGVKDNGDISTLGADGFVDVDEDGIPD